MPWRQKDGIDALIHEIVDPVLWVEITHNRNRHVHVEYYNNDGENVEIAVEYLDSNRIKVSSVGFILGTIVIL